MKKILIADDEPNIVAAIEFLPEAARPRSHTGAWTAAAALAIVAESFRTSSCST
jgi:hypothetical protein